MTRFEQAMTITPCVRYWSVTKPTTILSRMLPALAVCCHALNAQAPVAPAPSVFSPASEVNRALPRWLIFGGEYRARFEGYSGGNFKPDSTDAYWLSRVRLNMTIRPVSWMTIYAEGQDARAIGKQPGQPPFENTWDIRQGFVDLGNADRSLFAVRIGRQEINFGDQRLVGSTNWSNTARTFDAVRAISNIALSRAAIRLDLFASSVVNAVNDTWDHHQDGNNFNGAHAEITKLLPGASIEPFLYWKLQRGLKNEAGVVANLNEKVFGVRWVGKLPPGFDYQLEVAKEVGSLGSDSVQAWAGHWVVGRTIASIRLAPRVWAEYNYATGDANSKDGIRGTFDHLYPTSHDKYGLSDQVGWKNMRDLRTGVETRLRKNLTTTLEYNDWHLASAFDALYNTSGTALARSATGTAGTHIGQEVDVVGNWTVSNSLQVSTGIGHLFPGEFLKKTTPGVGYTFPYFMFLYRF
jgi:hypothetical protein